MEFLLGFLIAAAVGLTGVGAGTITAPMLILLFHLPAAESVGTALTFAAVIKLVVLPLYLRRKQVGFRILALLCARGIPGVLGGVYLLNILNARKHEHLLFLVLGATILTMSIFNLYRTLRNFSREAAHDRSRWLPPIAAIIGAEVGFSSAGAGALGSLALLNLTTLTPAQVVGTDMVFGLVVSLVGGGFHFFAGHYNGAILTKLIVGGIGGALVGANLSSILPARPLRMALSVWLASVGVQLFWKAVA
jgi:uncharacterized membrane protein YfcA